MQRTGQAKSKAGVNAIQKSPSAAWQVFENFIFKATPSSVRERSANVGYLVVSKPLLMEVPGNQGTRRSKMRGLPMCKRGRPSFPPVLCATRGRMSHLGKGGSFETEARIGNFRERSEPVRAENVKLQPSLLQQPHRGISHCLREVVRKRQKFQEKQQGNWERMQPVEFFK